MKARFRPVWLQGFRAGVLIFLLGLIHDQARWHREQTGFSAPMSQVRTYFSEARRVGPRDAERGMQLVYDRTGDTIGALITTSPEMDFIRGYSGPNNILLALDPKGTILGLELLSSGDTPEYVDKVRDHPDFLNQFTGWNPASTSTPPVAAISGATLTTLAVTEAIRQRLRGAGPSLRFPDPVTLSEVQELFPKAATLEREGTRFVIRDTTGQLLGYAMRTSPQADNVSGYSGPTELLAGLKPDGETVFDFIIRQSYDTPSYVDDVRADSYYMGLFKGRSLTNLAALDYDEEEIEGVSGATQTSWAMIEGLKRRAAAALQEQANRNTWSPQPHDWALAGVMAGALIMAFTSLRGRSWARWCWQGFLVVYVGWLSGDFLSLSLLGGWAVHGPAWSSISGMVLVAALAFLVPWLTRRQVYCHQVCPHGAAQQLLGALSRRRATVPANWSRLLEKVPVLLLAFGLSILLLNLSVPLTELEGFDAWTWPTAGWITVGIALTGLVASWFVPMAYCRYGCPTGALLSFVRTAGSRDRWSVRDWTAIGLIAFCFLQVAATRLVLARETEPPALTLHGRTMGTTWMVRIRDDVVDPKALEEDIAKEFNWADSMTSHWNAHTDLSAFNMSDSTNALAVPWPVVKLAGLAESISQATGGAFDITVGPLVRLWGFGPAPRRTSLPYQEDIEDKLQATGWNKLHVLEGQLRKDHPGLEIDLSALAPGWAVDEVVRLLEFKGYHEFLVETGGELRTRGRWTIGVEHPDRQVRLQDEAIGTSGTYRQQWEFEGRTYSHLVDPRTGRPVTHNTVSVSVRHERCADADAWAAALNLLGHAEGWPLALQNGLAAQFVQEQEDGSLEVRATPAWEERDQRR